MACDFKSHDIILWRVISVKLNNGKKKNNKSEIITLNREKIQHVPKLIELMFKGELHCSQGCFGKQSSREDV